jgi:hypothetical protein
MSGWHSLYHRKSTSSAQVKNIHEKKFSDLVFVGLLPVGRLGVSNW